MKIDIEGNSVESENNLNVGEILCKSKYDNSVIGALVDGELRDTSYQPKKNVTLVPVRGNSK